MYKISVPVMNSIVQRAGREKTLQLLRQMDAERVFLSLDTYEMDPQKRKEVMERLRENCRYFKERGFEVGAWIWTFWVKGEHGFRCMHSLDGSPIGEFMCPTDERFVEFSASYIAEVAKTGVDMIQFDDDFRYGFLSEYPACLCEEHIARINRLTGEHSTRDELKMHILTGGKNKYRDAWLQVNGEAFESFAAGVRKAVDSVDPTIRMGACACMTSWDIDGTNAARLARILAGNTRPFVRLIGAPYWVVNRQWGNCLQDVVELERMESAWTRNGDIEIMAEGDAYPRPRTTCPAAYLEGFDTAIRAAGCTDGILKYGIDYWSNADYETGYAQAHVHNRSLYQQLDTYFRDKTACGVRVYVTDKKMSDAEMSGAVYEKTNMQNDLFFPVASRTLAHNAIPTTYEGEGITGIVFDENARHLPLPALKNGLILDIAAAEILMARGVDVGIETIGATVGTQTEHFLADNNYMLSGGMPVSALTLKPGAEILSDTETAAGVLPMSYRYENANGNRFLVLNMHTRYNIASQSNYSDPLKQYARGRQYVENIEWLSGNKLPASICGHPSLYMQCKEGDGALAVGLWNFYPDIVFAPTVKLAKPYTAITFIGCDGTLDGDTVTLTDIPAFGFAGFEVKE